ncbi:MAG: hypothetical protein KF830_07885 [Planctomycetes bacterium]|nr:hypothetical protein [Planctomycetota bacterium]
MKSWLQPFLLGAGFGVAFLGGQLVARPLASAAPWLEAQGRGPTNPPPPAPPPGTTPPEGTPAAPAIVYSEEAGSTASANGFVAVTGSYGVGTSVLYLVDTVNRQLAVYEARGGGAEQRRIVLVGARRIDLDLQLQGYNDRSEYDYERLQNLFGRRGGNDRSIRTGLEGGGGRK